MDTQILLEKAAAALAPWALASSNPETNRLDVTIAPENLKPAVSALLASRWGYFAALTGLDVPPSGEGETAKEGMVECLYHFCEGSAVTTLRISVPYSRAVLDSICDLIPSATLYERELLEMFGVDLTGTPSRERLLLADDWPDGVYPLRKSFTGLVVSNEKENLNGCAA